MLFCLPRKSGLKGPELDRLPSRLPLGELTDFRCERFEMSTSGPKFLQGWVLAAGHEKKPVSQASEQPTVSSPLAVSTALKTVFRRL